MENIRLQQRVEDLEKALARIQSAIDDVSKTDISFVNYLSFQDGFKHAADMCKSVTNIHINGVLI